MRTNIMKGQAGTVSHAVRHTGFSLTKITNLASCLMTVLLALNLHSLAAQINQPAGDAARASAGKDGPAKTYGTKPHGTDPHGVRAHGGKADAHKTGQESQAGLGIVLPAPEGSGKVSSGGIRPGQQRKLMDHLQGWSPVNGLADDDPAAGQKDEEAPDSRMRLAEQGLEGEITAHRQAMRQQAETLRQQRQSLEAEQKELDEKLQALGRNASELSAEQEQRRKDVEQGIARLAHVYEDMPPRDAAAMFNVLDMRVMVPVAQHMIPRRISDVIGNMQPDRANILSQYLAGIRKLSPDALSRMNSPADYPAAP